MPSLALDHHIDVRLYGVFWSLVVSTAALLAVIAPAVRALALPHPEPVPAESARLRVAAAAVGATAAAGGLMLTGHLLLYTYLAPLLQELGGHDARARALLLLVFGLGGLVGIVLSGPLSDRFPQHALLAVGAALAPAAAAAGLVGAGGPVAAAVLGFWAC